MNTFRSFLLSETITQATLDKLRADANAFTKNVRRIKTLDEYQQVVRAFRVWQQHWHDFVYNNLMGLNRHGGSTLEKGKESWDAKELREKAWTLYISSDLFVSKGAPDPPYDSNPDAWKWQRSFEDFTKNRDKIYDRLARIIRDGFKAVDLFVDTQRLSRRSAVLPDFDQKIRTTVAGFPVTIVNNEAGDDDRHNADTLKRIHAAVSVVKQRGLGTFLRDLQFEVRNGEWEQRGFGIAGTYDVKTRTIAVYPLGNNASTIVHEIGHHVFRTQLLNSARARWETLITRNRITFTDDELQEIADAYLEAFEAERHQPTVGYVVDQFLSKHVAARVSHSTQIKLRHYLTQHFGSHGKESLDISPNVNADMSYVRSERNELITNLKKGVSAFVPTAYAHTNPEEAFCEVFAMFVLKKPLADMMYFTIASILGVRP
jgi:hypothetical protein